MAKLNKVYDEIFNKGAVSDDDVTTCLAILNSISHKPTDDDHDEVNGDVGEFSYYTIYDKRFRIVVYIEE